MMVVVVGVEQTDHRTIIILVLPQGYAFTLVTNYVEIQSVRLKLSHTVFISSKIRCWV